MIKDIKTIFGENLKRLRNKRQVTSVDLASILGVSQSTISDWENGKKMPRAGAIEKLSDYFKIKALRNKWLLHS